MQRKITNFLFFFFSYLFMPAKINILARIVRNWLEWSKFAETGQNFFQDGKRRFIVSVYTPMRDFPTIPTETEQHSQL